MSALARVRWYSPNEGGRSAPPPGQEYTTVAKFDRQTDQEWRRAAWSLVLSFKDPADGAWTQTASVRFLNEADAPPDLLSPGRGFTLFEGSRRVAEGLVL
jgi:hypothetical protein